MQEGEHAGSRTYLSYLGLDPDGINSADEMAGAEPGWAEDDDWQDEIEMGSASQHESTVRYLQRSEMTPSNRINSLIDVENKVSRLSHLRRNRDSESATGSVMELDRDRGKNKNSGNAGENLKRRRPRRTRNKAIIAAAVLAQILYSSNQSANAFQTIIAAYSFASRTGKRAMGVLNQLGLSVSPTTFANALKQNASASMAAVKTGIQEGRKIALFYDNLVLYDKKAEESEVNKNRSLQLTACGGYFLLLPEEGAEQINATKDPALCLRSREVPDENDLSTQIAMRTPDAESLKAHQHMHEPAIEPEDPLDSPHFGSETNSHPAMGIQSELLFRSKPDYSKITPLDILCTESVRKYFEATVKAHLCILLRKHFCAAIDANKNKSLCSREYLLKSLFQVPVKKSDIFTLPTLNLDESTVDGNAAILETLVQSLDLPLETLQGTTIPISGDQMTLGRIRSVQQLRIRDKPEHRATFAAPWMGFLHYGFATIDTIKRCDAGASEGGDPGSLSTFVHLLGRTGSLRFKTQL